MTRSLIALRLHPGGRNNYTVEDIIKFFSKKSMVDTIDSQYNSKTNPKLYRVWYRINQNTVIQVKTWLGMSARELACPVTADERRDLG